jgi:lysine/ornithine N-monooxygenase
MQQLTPHLIYIPYLDFYPKVILPLIQTQTIFQPYWTCRDHFEVERENGKREKIYVNNISSFYHGTISILFSLLTQYFKS